MKASSCGLARFLCLFGLLAAPAGGQTFGWRGNWTGLYPDAEPPTTWSRTPKGPTQGLRCSSAELAADEWAKAEPVREGLITQWLTIGPITVKDSVKQFDEATLCGEIALAPAEGLQVDGLTWRRLTVAQDRFELGRAEVESVDLGKDVGTELNQVAYACTWLHAATPGRVRAVVDHHFGFKVWVNDRVVYANAERQVALGYYTAISRHKLANTAPKSAAFEFDLRAGWNRVFCKVTTANKGESKEMRFAMRVGEVEGVEYASSNIRWMAELPERGNAAPLVVGDRIFVAAEPDELLCFDKNTGKRLWSAFVNYEAATPQAERDANPVFQEKVDPLVARLKAETDAEKRLAIRRELTDLMTSISAKKYALKMDGHFESHYAIVGLMTPTPCSDGKHVYVWSGTGVAACYDLSGQRKWITRVSKDLLSYASAPALIGDRFIVYLKKLYALDATTGAVLWTQKEVNKNSAAILPARLAGVDCVVSQQGEVVRASDGAMLYQNPRKIGGDTGWAAPAVIGDKVYLPWSGITSFIVFDFANCTGEQWKPAERTVDTRADSRRPDGKWLDRWTAASPVIRDGHFYDVDIYATFYDVDLTGKAPPAQQELPLRGVFHYNAVPVAASPALIGKYIYVMDNQGHCAVLEPTAGALKLIAVNHLGTQLKRDWPTTPQEMIAYAPIVPDGKRLFIRGERYLYCIGAE